MSFSLSLLMALNIFLVKELRSRVYQQLLVLLAITDLIKTSSWFLGPKYMSPYEICSVQEYIFQFGSLAQALVAALICSVAYLTVAHRQVPSTPRLMLYLGGLLLVLIVSVSLNIAFRTSRLFCGQAYSGFSESHFRTELYIYSIGILFPILSTVVLNLGTYLAINRRFKRMNVVLNLSESDAPLHILVYRLRAYPIIYSACYMPLLLIYITTTSMGQFSRPVGAIAAMCVSSLGSAVSLNYFFYQKTLAPSIKTFVSIWKPLLVGDSSSGRCVQQGDRYNSEVYDGNETVLTDPMLGGTDDDYNDQITFSRYFPSIDMTEPSTGEMDSLASGNKHQKRDEYLLTVD